MRGKSYTELEFNTALGRIMERRRLAEGLSRRQVLRLMGDHRSPSLLCKCERGVRPVALPFMLRWCEIMGVGLTELLTTVEAAINR